jgi:hypothetical protein
MLLLNPKLINICISNYASILQVVECWFSAKTAADNLRGED